MKLVYKLGNGDFGIHIHDLGQNFGHDEPIVLCGDSLEGISTLLTVGMEGILILIAHELASRSTILTRLGSDTHLVTLIGHYTRVTPLIQYTGLYSTQLSRLVFVRDLACIGFRGVEHCRLEVV